MNAARIGIIILLICLGLAGCARAELSVIEIKLPTAETIPTDPTQALVKPSLTPSSTPEPTATITPLPILPSVSPPCIAENGHIEIKQLESEWLLEPLDYRVYLPPCYDQLPDQHYPVLYLIHGYGFNDDQWIRLGVNEVADRLFSSQKLRPFLIIMPHDRNHNVQPPENAFGDSLNHELVPEVDKNYRTRPDRKYRAIGGLSRGGNWAIHIGLSNWMSFSRIGGHSAPLFVTDGPSQVRSWLDNIPQESQPDFFLDVGERDKWLQHIINFEETLDRYNVPHELYIFPGGHTEAYWSVHVEQYLRWYGRDW